MALLESVEEAQTLAAGEAVPDSLGDGLAVAVDLAQSPHSDPSRGVAYPAVLLVPWADLAAALEGDLDLCLVEVPFLYPGLHCPVPCL